MLDLSTWYVTNIGKIVDAVNNQNKTIRVFKGITAEHKLLWYVFETDSKFKILQ